MIRHTVAATVALVFILAHVATAQTSIETEVRQLWEARLFAQSTETLEQALSLDTNDPVANRLYAEAYAKGLGVEQSSETAVRYYRTSATAGDPAAMFALGQAYERGQGIPQSTGSAMTWYELAAPDHPEASLRYAEIVLANQGRDGFSFKHDPMDRLRFASDAGIPRAMHILATLMLQAQPTGDELEASMELLRHAAQTLPAAQTSLAIIHHERKEHADALKLFALANTQGETNAAAYLGHYAEFGIEQPIDREKAFDYYAQAQDVEWAVQGADRIREHTASIEVFGIRVYGATRQEITAAFTAKGIVRLGGEEYFDAYDVTQLVGVGPAVLTVAYAPGAPEFVAELNYRFEPADGRNVRALQDQLRESLQQKYGEASIGQRGTNGRPMSWTVGQTNVQLHAVTRERFVNVTYHLKPFSTTLADYIDRRRSAQEGGIDNAL